MVFGITLLSSIAIHWVGAELSDMSWNWKPVSPKNAAPIAQAQSSTPGSQLVGGCVVYTISKNHSGSIEQSIDLPEYRWRLWDWSDCPIWYYLKNYNEIRKNQRNARTNQSECSYEVEE
jgi:hypothetical protein